MTKQKTTTQTIRTATKVVTIFVLAWIFALSVLTIFNLCAIIKKDRSITYDLPPITDIDIEYLEVD